LTENCNSKYISEEDSKKILNNIYWDDKNHIVKSVECSYDNENWINKHVKVAVYLETSEGKKEVYYIYYYYLCRLLCLPCVTLLCNGLYFKALSVSILCRLLCQH